MFIAHQVNPTKSNLQFLKQIGVDHVISSGPSMNSEGCWGYDDILKLKAFIESAGLSLAGLNNVIGTPGLGESNRGTNNH